MVEAWKGLRRVVEGAGKEGKVQYAQVAVATRIWWQAPGPA